MSERISTSSSSLCSSFSNCRLQSTSGTRRGRNALSHLGGITRPSSSSPHGDSGCTTKSSHEVGSLTLQTHISWVKPIFCFSKTNKKGSECFNGHEAAKMTVALFPLVDTLENLNPVLDLREVCQGLNSSHLATKRNPRTFQPKIPQKIPQFQEVSPYSESVFPVVPGPVPRRQKSAWLTPTCPCRHLPPPRGRSEARRIPPLIQQKAAGKKISRFASPDIWALQRQRFTNCHNNKSTLQLRCHESADKEADVKHAGCKVLVGFWSAGAVA